MDEKQDIAGEERDDSVWLKQSKFTSISHDIAQCRQLILRTVWFCAFPPDCFVIARRNDEAIRLIVSDFWIVSLRSQ
jgi:hypothetical protein